MRVYIVPKVLVIDEMGYLPLDECIPVHQVILNYSAGQVQSAPPLARQE